MLKNRDIKVRVGIENAAVASIEPGTVKSRGGLAFLHVDAAIRFTSDCIQIVKGFDENAQADTIKGDKASIRACVIGALYTSVAFLEAFINEVFLDAVESIPENARKEKDTRITVAADDVNPYGVVESLVPETIKNMAQMWLQQERYRSSNIQKRLKNYLEQKDPSNWIERWRTLDKYQLALCLNQKKPFEKNQAEAVAVRTLVEFRHYLTHAKPEWVILAAPKGKFVGPEKSTDLERQVRELINSDQLRPKTGYRYEMHFLDSHFPHSCLSPTYARMAVKFCLEFDQLFCNQMGMTDIRSKYSELGPALSTILL